MPNQYSYREKYQAELSRMTNRELLDEVYATSQTDDYEVFTIEGLWQLEVSRAELERRLTEIGWL